MAKGSFALNIAKFAEKAKENADLVVRKVTIDVATSVIEKSPVGNPDLWKGPAPAGYVGGRFRANWMFGEGAPDATTTDELDASGQTTISRLIAEIGSTGAGGVNYLSNNLPYGPRIEFEGWSSQAPKGMVRITVAEFEQYVQKAVAELA